LKCNTVLGRKVQGHVSAHSNIKIPLFTDDIPNLTWGRSNVKDVQLRTVYFSTLMTYSTVKESNVHIHGVMAKNKK